MSHLPRGPPRSASGGHLGNDHSVYAEDSTVRFVDGRLVEQSPEGTAIWGNVVEWSPPELLRITWHPGRDAIDHTDVTVRFAAIRRHPHTGDARTLGLGKAGRSGLGPPRVRQRLGHRDRSYTAHVAPSAIADRRDDDTVWLALSHTASVAAPADGNVFEHPLFGQHVRFVLGLQAAGLLVGAGSIAGRPGHGKTIIRIPAPVATDYARAAQDDDPSVAGGLLMVDVDVWGVRMTS